MFIIALKAYVPDDNFYNRLSHMILTYYIHALAVTIYLFVTGNHTKKTPNVTVSQRPYTSLNWSLTLLLHVSL